MSIDKIDQFMTYLPAEFGDPSLIILKGHLLLEIALKDYISKRVNFPGRLDKGQVSFSSLILFASTLEDKDGDRWLWQALKMANKIRNQVAHSLDASKLSALENAFVAYVQLNDGEFAVEVNAEELPYRPLALVFMQLFDCITGSRPADTCSKRVERNSEISGKIKAAFKQVCELIERGE